MSADGAALTGQSTDWTSETYGRPAARQVTIAHVLSAGELVAAALGSV